MNITNEIWKPVVGYESLYLISNTGKVYSLINNIPRKSSKYKKSGYLYVNLCIYGKCTKKKIHRLVAEAFIPNPENLPQVNHKDGNKLNNCEWNLEWCTSKHNILHGMKIGLIKNQGEDNNYSKFSNIDILNIKMRIKNNENIPKIAKDYNVNKSTIYDIRRGVTWSHIKIN